MRKAERPLAFVLAASDQGTLIVNRFDSHQKPHQPPFGVGYSLLSKASFDADEIDIGIRLLDLLREFRGNDVVVLDCGANIGVHTVEWAKHMTGWGQVISFEAQERIYYALAGNISINNCFNARAFHVALGDRAGSINIPVLNYCAPASFGSLEIKKRINAEEIGQNPQYDTGTQNISLARIDDFNLSRVDFIKIDVEGMECDVLEGAKDTIIQRRPYILVEHNKSGMDNIARRLTNAGYVWWEAGINLLALPKGDPAVSRISV